MLFRFFVCLITGHTGGKVNNLLKCLRNRLRALFNCRIHFMLSLYYLDVYDINLVSEMIFQNLPLGPSYKKSYNII
jgi:hypothetical protein